MYSYMGFRKTAVFVILVVVLSTFAGLGYGYFVGNPPTPDVVQTVMSLK
jgi:hypothetical protein